MRKCRSVLLGHYNEWNVRHCKVELKCYSRCDARGGGGIWNLPLAMLHVCDERLCLKHEVKLA